MAMKSSDGTKTKIHPDENFIRIFQLPDRLSTEFCFAGGVPTKFTMVDWFNPIPTEELDGFDLFDIQKRIREFVREKPWYQKDKRYIGMTNYQDVFFI